MVYPYGLNGMFNQNIVIKNFKAKIMDYSVYANINHDIKNEIIVSSNSRHNININNSKNKHTYKDIAHVWRINCDIDRRG